MGPVLREIKEVFDRYKIKYHNKKPCDSDPFDEQHWMYHYLFPEVLLVMNEYHIENDEWWYGMCDFNLHKWGDEDMFPCMLCSEEQVLRIMAEHGLL